MNDDLQRLCEEQTKEIRRLSAANALMLKSCKSTIEAWNKWIDADGWDNECYDEFARQLYSMELMIPKVERKP